jgi:AbrB family looped-hinge helix DNA binding protein
MMTTTRLSSKGQLVLPKSVRDARGWEGGTVFDVIDGGKNAVTLVKREADVSERNLTLAEFRKLVPKYDGPPVTDRMINEAVLAEAKRRWHAKGG